MLMWERLAHYWTWCRTSRMTSPPVAYVLPHGDGQVEWLLSPRIDIYSLLHLECDVISISNLNLIGLFSTESGKRDLELDLRLTFEIEETVRSCHRVWMFEHWRRGVVTGWRRPIGCLKLQVILRKRATNYRALLRKMTCEDKASYGSSPPCS